MYFSKNAAQKEIARREEREPGDVTQKEEVEKEKRKVWGRFVELTEKINEEIRPFADLIGNLGKLGLWS